VKTNWFWEAFGKHAIEARLNELGYELSPEDMEKIFTEFKNHSDKKEKTITERGSDKLWRGAEKNERH
jgi:2-isopropylmalate synthase